MSAIDIVAHIAPPDLPDKADVQGLIPYGYTHHLSRHFLLRVTDPRRAREFIAGLVKSGYITNASLSIDDVNGLKDQGRCPVNIGFTYRGLEALELRTPYLRVFQEKAPAFAEGARQRGSRRLADTGPSAVERWEPVFDQDAAHLLLCLHADEKVDLDNMTAEIKKIAGFDGLDEIAREEPEHLGRNKDRRNVHFGLRDGIANPTIKGFHDKELHDKKPLRKLHAPGEFLLGYPDDSGANPWLLVNPWPLPNPWLLPLSPVDPRFFRNGSFGALRKMEQHEHPFRAFVADWAGRLRESEEYVKAKLTGRWNNGVLVQPGETSSPADPAPGTDLNDFDLSKDPEGTGCPFGSHIRRMNPRADLVVPFRRRPLIRRGMPYGPAFKEEEKQEEGIRRGMLGLFFCASLEDQFEHLIVEWGNANPMGPHSRGDAKDPLVGNHENPDAIYDIPMPDEKLRQLNGFTSFVTTRGTLYAFFPGCAALAMIPDLAKIPDLAGDEK